MPSPSKIQFVELSDWMTENGRTVRGLALETGLDKMTISRLLRGEFQRLERETIVKISNATAGAVGHVEFAAYLGRLSQPKAA